MKNRVPWTRAELDELIPPARARIDAAMAADEAEFGEIKPVGPMTHDECLDYFSRLLDVAQQRPLTGKECFLFGQLFQCFKQAVQAEMLGKKGRYYVVSAEQLAKVLAGEMP